METLGNVKPVLLFRVEDLIVLPVDPDNIDRKAIKGSVPVTYQFLLGTVIVRKLLALVEEDIKDVILKADIILLERDYNRVFLIATLP